MIYILILFCFLFSACDDDLNTSKGISHITRLAKRKYNLDCIGSGIQGPNIIKNFRLVFESFETVDENQARELLVNLTEDYIKLINSLPDVLQFIDKKPLNESHAFILITFIEKDGSYNPCLNAIALANGNIEFLKKTTTLEEYKIENYNEAYFKVFGTNTPLRS